TFPQVLYLREWNEVGGQPCVSRLHFPWCPTRMNAQIGSTMENPATRGSRWPRKATSARAMSTPRLNPDPNESELIERVCAGEKECFYTLVRPYERAVFTAAMSILNNAADAEDVAQEAVLKAFKHLAGFRREAKFSTWLVQITINEARLKLRK